MRSAEKVLREKSMAAAGQHEYYEGRLSCDLTEIKSRLIQELNYSEAEAEKLVSELSQLLSRVDGKLQVSSTKQLYSIASSHCKEFKLLLECLNKDERHQLLTSKDIAGTTILHFAARERYAKKAVEIILKSTEEETQYALLSAQDAENQVTPVHRACFFGNTEVLTVMIGLTTEETWYKLLQIPNRGGCTAVHQLAWQGHAKGIETIAKSLKSQNIVNLLKIKDNFGKTPQKTAEYEGKQEAAELLQRLSSQSS